MEIMGIEAIKLELIKWLSDLSDNELIKHLKTIKDAQLDNNNWWSELSDEQKEGIQRGLKDIDEGRTTPHENVAKK